MPRNKKAEKMGFVDITEPGLIGRTKAKAKGKAEKAITRNPQAKTPITKNPPDPGGGRKAIKPKKPVKGLIRKVDRDK
jgi:hypothetical protein